MELDGGIGASLAGQPLGKFGKEILVAAGEAIIGPNNYRDGTVSGR